MLLTASAHVQWSWIESETKKDLEDTMTDVWDLWQESEKNVEEELVKETMAR